MCGIAGFIQTNPNIEQNIDTIKEMLALIQHRGPDEAGYYFDSHVAFGSTRLRIIDLVSGTQPLSDNTQKYWISYNGEIYNYRELRSELIDLGYKFTTSCDTEVLLYAWIAWQQDALLKLNGAFAFAIYNSINKSFVLARDRYGQRPLYYYAHNGEFAFASEMKCFLAHNSIPFSFDVEQVTSIFGLWTPLPNETAFKNIQQLPPGTFLHYHNQEIEVKNYYHLDFQSQKHKSQNLTDLQSQLSYQLQKSVELRMRSDVSVGTYLSGGLDSSIVTALCSNIYNKQLHSFSVTFDEQEFDESSEQNIVSSLLETQHTNVNIKASDIVQNFPQAIWHSETPVFRTALVPMLLLAKKVHELGIKVVLTGEGADESFLGYNIFKETFLRTHWDDTNQQSRQQILYHLYPYLQHLKAVKHASLIKMYQKSSTDKEDALFSHAMRFSNNRFALRLLDNDLDPYKNLRENLAKHANFSSLNSIQKAQWIEFQTLLSGYLLSSQGDRMSLAYGVENRCPFLDYNLVHWASSLPQDLKLRSGYDEKYILKQTFANTLPKQILARAKQPYRAPGAKIFLESNEEYLQAIFSEHEVNKIGFINMPFYTKFIKKLQSFPDKISPRENNAFLLLLSLSLLNNLFIERKYTPNPQLAFNLKIDGHHLKR